MERRAFMAMIAGGIVAPFGAEAQRAGRVYRIGFLGVGEAAQRRLDDAFKNGLREFGFTVGENTVIEYRWLGNRLHAPPGHTITSPISTTSGGC